ncbi:MAG: HEAT repeat domain-containing protein, partial [Sedimentisphaerales bacterium]|nr:HEAT repeat domain-containing protein [Sedimentisphaerales bacterium]
LAAERPSCTMIIVRPAEKPQRFLRAVNGYKDALQRLGGTPERTAHAIGLYLRLPEGLAPNQPEACHLLALCGLRMVPTLRLALGSRSREVRLIAAKLACDLGAGAVPLAPEAAALLGDEDGTIRGLAARTLGNMVSSAPRASNTIWRYSYDTLGRITSLPEPNWPRVKPEAAARPLGQEAAKKTVSALATALGDPDADVRTAAMDALSAFGKNATLATPALAGVLDGREESLMVNAAAVLAELGPDASAAVPALARCLASPSVDLRANAAVALASIVQDDAALEDMLKPVMEDASHQVREAITKALGERRARVCPR